MGQNLRKPFTIWQEINKLTNVSVVFVTSGTKGGKMRWEQQNMLLLNYSLDFFYSGLSSQFNLSKSWSIWFVLNIEHTWYSLLRIFATQVSDFGLVIWTDGIFLFLLFIDSGIRELTLTNVGIPLLTWIHFHHWKARDGAYSTPFSYAN